MSQREAVLERLKVVTGFCIGVALYNVCSCAFAAEVWLSPGGVSLHQDRSAGYRERNPGLILEVREGNHSVLGGQFKNSFSRDSHLLVYRYRAVERAGFGLGGAVGLVDGYPAGGGDPRPVAAPVASYDHKSVSLLVMAIPPATKEISGWVAIAAIAWRVW